MAKPYLTAPASSLKVDCTPTDRFVRFEYVGSPETLIKAGAVEVGMTKPERSGKPRFDTFGDRFTRHKLRNGRIRITRIVTDSARAAALPGASGDLSTPLLTKLRATPDQVVPAGNDIYLCYAGTKASLIRDSVAPADAFDFRDRKRDKWLGGNSGVMWVEALRDGFYMVKRTCEPKMVVAVNNSEAWAAILTGKVTGTARKLDRYVGRFQRHAMWITTGNVIVPQWAAMVGERLGAAL
jgi:hypothetical protein